MSSPTNFQELCEYLEICPRVRISRHGLGPGFEAEFYLRDSAGWLWFRPTKHPLGPVWGVGPEEDVCFEPEGFTRTDEHNGKPMWVEYLP